MRLSVIIVNYKSTQLLLNCLKSLYQFDNHFIEVIVVDNFSQDDVEAILHNQYPEVKFIQMGYNAGFARANNAGIRMASGKSILLLNSDTIIIDDAVNRCLHQFEMSDYIACGVQLLNEDGTPQISGNFAMKGGLNYLLPLPIVGDLIKLIATFFKVKKPNVPDAKGIVEVDWINGAFLMVKKSVINKRGMLDEDFFLYAEESEWCSRLQKEGKLCIYGDCKVYHLQGATANEVFASSGKGYYNLFDKKGYQIMLSNFVRIRKQFGVFWFLFDWLIYFLTIPVFFLSTLVHKLIFSKKPMYRFSNNVDFIKNVMSILLLSVKIIKNKPHFYKVL